jgi:hypothetical protein
VEGKEVRFGITNSNGWPTRSGHSPGRLRFSTMSGAIPTVSPSPITDWCPWTTASSVPLEDYREDNRQKTMTLPAEEFIRRFLIHVLSNGFQSIRYYGFLSNCHRARKLSVAGMLDKGIHASCLATTELLRPRIRSCGRRQGPERQRRKQTPEPHHFLTQRHSRLWAGAGYEGRYSSCCRSR